MTLADLRLRYTALLLSKIAAFPVWSIGPNDWPRLFDLCDRFERCIAQIHPPTLVWEGDQA